MGLDGDEVLGSSPNSVIIRGGKWDICSKCVEFAVIIHGANKPDTQSGLVIGGISSASPANPP